MQAQDLHVGDPQAVILDRAQYLGECRCVATGEDVFAQPWIGTTGRLHSADRVQQHDPVLGKQLFRLAEEFAVVRGADMLEHAD